jgi:hypothetical protein
MKILINQVHTGALWLDKAYPIYVENIHKITSLSMEGHAVIDGFHGLWKHEYKREELSIYEIYGTKQGVRGMQIAPIKDEQVCMACYLIVGKILRNYTRNECTLGFIVVVELSNNATPLNWCDYLLIKCYNLVHMRTKKRGTSSMDICW